MVASLIVTCRCTGVAHSSNADSVSGVLVRMVSSRFSASICSNPLWLRFSFKAFVRTFNALVIVSAGVKVGCVMNFVLKNTVSDTLSLFVCFT